MRVERRTNDVVRLTADLVVTFHRTLRVPEGNALSALPAGLGKFPVYSCEASEALPAGWTPGDLLIPMYQREALWIAFHAPAERPHAVIVSLGSLNAISGKADDQALRAPQNYLVAPLQPWLDGINAADGSVRQFVTVPLESGESVEWKVLGKESDGALVLSAFEALSGKVHAEPPEVGMDSGPRPERAAAPTTLGIGAGGMIQQRIYGDPFGLEAWQLEASGHARVRVLNSEQFRAATGLEPPPSPISAEDYARLGLPWFALYDEALAHVPAAEAFRDSGLGRPDTPASERSKPPKSG